MRLRGFVVLLAALAGAVVLGSPVSAITTPQTFSLLSVESDVEQEIGGFGFQREPVPGDRFAFTDQLYKWAGTKRGEHVGRTEGLCTFTKVSTREASARRRSARRASSCPRVRSQSRDSSTSPTAPSTSTFQ